MSARSRVRLVVLEVLAVSLFATLFTRLWYVQVVGGDAYRAQAQDNAVQQIILTPPRGLIVDDMGRPLVANRTAWVVTVDRTVLDNLGRARAADLLRRVADTVHLSYADVAARTKLCGEAGAEPPPVCWNGSPFQPVTVAEDVSQREALAIQEEAEDFPGVRAEARKVRAYPRPYGVNAAHVLGYLSPITEAELAAAIKVKPDFLPRARASLTAPPPPPRCGPARAAPGAGPRPARASTGAASAPPPPATGRP